MNNTRWDTKLFKLLQLIEEIKSSGDSRYMVLLYHVYIDWYYAHQMTLWNTNLMQRCATFYIHHN